MGVEAFAEKVEQEWAFLKDGPTTLTDKELDRVKACFTEPAYEAINDADANLKFLAQAAIEPAYARWLAHNTHDHKQAGYKSVTISLKETGIAPGDITDVQMDAVACRASGHDQSTSM